ncbi:dihydroneopterin aldolase [Hydrogenovibrio halophilus]|uniref:dihydroneopterin aldolase n=1 Tax=Hydrogenovibrio halophilus TaxID=373391 RepID=UPI00035EB937|nr:dihydroneopterin aldolase [Hydrogenovibrio halophilus]
MDTIHIRGIRAHCLIGVFDWEKQAPQPIDMDLAIGCDLRPAGQTDDLKQTLDYKAMADDVTAWAQASRFELIEALAESLCDKLLQTYPLAQSVRLTLMKPHAVPYVDNVGLTIERQRAQSDHKN